MVGIFCQKVGGARSPQKWVSIFSLVSQERLQVPGLLQFSKAAESYHIPNGFLCSRAAPGTNPISEEADSMSFGYSVGDFLACLKLAKSVYDACKDGPKEYKAIVGEVKCMSYILDRLHEDARDSQSLINRKGSVRKSELLHIIKNCEATLKEVEAITNDRSSLRKDSGRKIRRVWDAYHVGSADLDSLRGRLTFNTSVINAFLSSLKGASLTRIESKIDQIYVQLCQSRKAGDGSSVMSNASVETLDSVLSQIENHEDDAWNLIRRELQTEDIFSDQIEAHRDSIVSRIKSIVRGGSSSSGGDQASKEPLIPSESSCEDFPSLRLVEVRAKGLPAHMFYQRDPYTIADLTLSDLCFGKEHISESSGRLLQYWENTVLLDFKTGYCKISKFLKLQMNLGVDIRSQKDASFCGRPSVRSNDRGSCVVHSDFSPMTDQISSTRCEVASSKSTRGNLDWMIVIESIKLPLDIILTLHTIAELPTGEISFQRDEACRLRLHE